MIEEQKSVSFVCMANYCRSPVAKLLLKNKYGKLIKVDSAGLRPMLAAGMDPRSVDYLRQSNISYEIHNPKKIDKRFLNTSNIIFAMDTTILMLLNKLYKGHRNKIKLFTHKHTDLNILDPYKLNREEYKKVMNDINFVVENLVLEELE
tara:strand:+ start:2470 stop:2916 length:447 start_codon:yes stop_codon:yes gene_type:complete